MSEALDRIKELSFAIVASGNLDPAVPNNAEYNRLYDALGDDERRYADAYAECAFNGCSPKLADMLASQSPPMSNTDREFLEGHCCGNQFEKMPKYGDAVRKIAESHGQSTTGKVYLGGLAAFPGDPEAWVSGKDDVKRVCEQRGWSCDGAVSVAPRESPISRPARKAKPGSLASRLHSAGLPVASA